LQNKPKTFTVTGDDAVTTAAVPIFANFVAISHAGTEVQFEFIFLDLNEIAKAVGDPKHEKDESLQFKGKTVTKIIVPVANFVQLKDHLNGMFTRLEEAINEPKNLKETPEEGRKRASS
jgi:hypothetical protein